MGLIKGPSDPQHYCIVEEDSVRHLFVIARQRKTSRSPRCPSCKDEPDKCSEVFVHCPAPSRTWDIPAGLAVSTIG